MQGSERNALRDALMYWRLVCVRRYHLGAFYSDLQRERHWQLWSAGGHAEADPPRWHAPGGDNLY